MPRKRNWPPLPHPHRASGQERVRYEGHDYYLGPIGSALAKIAYGQLLERLEANRAQQSTSSARAGQEHQPATPDVPERKADLTVAELVERWDEYAVKRYDPQGHEVRQYRMTLDVVVAQCGILSAAQFGLVELGACRKRMIEKGWSRKVINRRVSRVRTVWRWAEGEEGLLPEGRWAALAVLTPLLPGDARVKDRPRRQPCSWEELARVCRKCSKKPRDILLVCWFSGARPGELRKARVGEIDTSGAEWVLRPARHKNTWRGHSRAVVLGPRAQKVLARYLPGKAPEDYVFEVKRGKCYSADGLSRAIRRARERAGVTTNVVAYLGRHAARQRATRVGSLDHARAMLGHKSVEMSAEYASGVDLEMAREIAKKIG